MLYSRRYFSILAAELNCDVTQSSSAAVKCLREKPAEDILRYQDDISHTSGRLKQNMFEERGLQKKVVVFMHGSVKGSYCLLI